MKNVCWEEWKTNENVLIMVDEKRAVLDRITNSKKRLIGHIVHGNGLSKELVEAGAVLAHKYWGGQLRAYHHRLGRHVEPHPKSHHAL